MNNIKLTVALPVYNSKNIVWLAMESLCRQQQIDFDWELIVCEEQNKNPAGIDFFKSFTHRLNSVRCKQIKYIPLNQWVPLSQKWRIIGKNTDQNSEVFLLQAADCYSAPLRLKSTYDALAGTDYDWYQQWLGLFYNIYSGKIILYTQNKEYPTALEMAMKTEYARNLPVSHKRKGVDKWLLSQIHNPKVYWEEKSVWMKGVNTHGMNQISNQRERYFEAPKKPFEGINISLKEILPHEIILRLDNIVNRVVHFVYPWIQKHTVWQELSMSIASIRKFYYGGNHIFVIGDKTSARGVTSIYIDRVKAGGNTRPFDIASKLDLIASNPDIKDDFVYMHDDMVFLRRFRFEDINMRTAVDLVEDIDMYFPAGKHGMPDERWVKIFKQTMTLLKDNGRPLYNYETHAPRVFNKAKVKELIEMFDLHNQPVLFSTLYFNHYYDGPDEILSDKPTFKASFYKPHNNYDRIKEAINGKLFLNYNNAGLTKELQNTIRKLMKD